MILADTNIFLEILLKQDKKKDCKAFLDSNAGKILKNSGIAEGV